LLKKLKKLRRAAALEIWANMYAVKALVEIAHAYR